MSVRSLTSRLREERYEAQRRSSNPLSEVLEAPVERSILPASPSTLFRGARIEPVDDEPVIVQIPIVNGLKPHVETPLSDIPGGIADRFRLKSQRMSEIAHPIDAHTSQVTAATTESDDHAEDPGSDTAPITIELHSH